MALDTLEDSITNYFALLEAWEFGRASYVAERIVYHGSTCKKLSTALQHLVTCESSYLSMRFLESRLPKLDATVMELEACLVSPPSAPLDQPAQLYSAAESPLGTIFFQIATCNFTPTFCSPPDVAATFTDGVVAAPEHPSVSPTHAAALKDSVQLLRLRKAMLQVYTRMQSGMSAEGFSHLADHVGELREAQAARLSAPLLRRVRAAALVELGAMQQLLLAQAMVPVCRARESLLAIAIAHTELSRLSTAERDEARERALLVAANTSSLGSGLGSRTGPQLAATTKASPEPALFRFLRRLCASLAAKSALYFQGLLGAPVPGASILPVATGAGRAMLAVSSLPTTDYAQLIGTFAQRSGALLAGLLFQAKGLHLRTAGGAVYTCCEDEAKLWAGTSVTAGKSQASASSESTPWPVLFMQPQSAPLPQLWPCIKRLISERQAQLQHGDVYVLPQPVSELGS